MFAVPGWAVSASTPKAETVAAAALAKKRKRPSETSAVTAKNVAELWESVIEGRSAKKAKGPDSKAQAKDKKQKKSKAVDGASHGDLTGQDAAQDEAKEPREEVKIAGEPGQDDLQAKPKKRKMKERRERRQREREEEARRNASDGTHQANHSSTKLQQQQPQAMDSKKGPPAPAAPKLTPLQASMREKLVSARFRHLNETLYTRPSAEAFSLFEDSPEMFQQYHEGFRRQADSWPSNPVDGYIADIKLRGRQKPLPKDHKHRSASQASGATQPLVRTAGTCTIADLGCGDAKLAEILQSEQKKLKLKILSFDLQSPSPLVTKADIANLPLEDGSVNVVIFCLALMGTNWLDFIEEAYRILHWKGELWISEIQSRFAPVGKGKKGGVVTHSVGNRKKAAAVAAAAAGKKGKKGPAEDEPNEEELAIVVDGAEDKRQETDVSTFVEALKRRGFLLQGDASSAIDKSNKMFVKMHFIKAAAPSVGKGIAAAAAAPAANRPPGGAGKKNGARFGEKKEDEVALDEDKILKPCVYKIR
jgi:ribosomal RNA-processing protein 8